MGKTVRHFNAAGTENTEDPEKREEARTGIAAKAKPQSMRKEKDGHVDTDRFAIGGPGVTRGGEARK